MDNKGFDNILRMYENKTNSNKKDPETIEFLKEKIDQVINTEMEIKKEKDERVVKQERNANYYNLSDDEKKLCEMIMNNLGILYSWILNKYSKSLFTDKLNIIINNIKINVNILFDKNEIQLKMYNDVIKQLIVSIRKDEFKTKDTMFENLFNILSSIFSVDKGELEDLKKKFFEYSNEQLIDTCKYTLIIK